MKDEKPGLDHIVQFFRIRQCQPGPMLLHVVLKDLQTEASETLGQEFKFFSRFDASAFVAESTNPLELVEELLDLILLSSSRIGHLTVGLILMIDPMTFLTVSFSLASAGFVICAFENLVLLVKKVAQLSCI